MPIHNLFEYSDNYSMIWGSLWNYYRDEINDDDNQNDDNENMINNNKTTTSKSFKCKTKIIENASRINAEVAVPQEYLSNFWRSVFLPLINCEAEAELRLERNCIISEISRTFTVVDGNANKVAYEMTSQTTSSQFQINNAKVYVPVVTLSNKNNMDFWENIKQVFKKTISGNKYRYEITAKSKNNSLDYLLDPTFRNINRLFVLSFKNGDDDPTRS